MDLSTLVQRAEPAAFALLAVASIVSWARNRERSRALVAGALGLLGAVGLLGEAPAPLGLAQPAAEALSIAVFVGSGYLLILFRDRFIPLPRLLRWVTPLALIAVIIVGSLARLPSGVDLHYSPVQALVLVAIVTSWSACVAEPVVRFWLAARGRPAVQRSRLRLMSVGLASLVLVLLITVCAGSAAAFSSAELPVWTTTALQLMALGIAPLIYLSLAPPAWLRRIWRGQRDATYLLAIHDLMTYAPDQATVAERALRRAAELLGADSGVLIDGEGRLIASTGMTAQEALHLAADTPQLEGSCARLIGKPVRSVVAPVRRNGSWWRLVLVAGPFTRFFGSDEVVRLEEYCVAMATALERVALHEQIGGQRQQYELLLQSVSDMGSGLVITTGEKVVYANEAYCQMSGYTEEELKNLPALMDLVAPEDRERVTEIARTRFTDTGQSGRYECGMITKDGTRIEVETAVRVQSSEDRSVIGMVHDVTRRKQAEDQLREVAATDPVTGVGNRLVWDTELERAIAHARRSGERLHIAILDLDGFKSFNDDWGHQKGDHLLREIAQSWRGALREVDLIARYGGDEFVLLLPGCQLGEALGVIERLRAITPEHQTASIGVAAWDGRENAESLVSRADLALFDCKRAGRASLSVANDDRPPDMQLDWPNKLAELIAGHEIASVYQPIVRLSDGALVGYEALARPLGQAAGSSVDDLFRAAYRHGRARDLDWLCRRAAVQGAHPIPPGTPLFVNVGVWALLDPVHDVDQMLLLLRWAKRRPQDIVLEISERDAIQDLQRFRHVLRNYREEGFRFALDDVGEGFSTLEVLSAADAEFIKAARSLTVNADAPGPGSLINALVTFATSTGATVIAEGIETDEMAAQMAERGVQMGQGYALGRPAELPVTASSSKQRHRGEQTA